MEEKPKNERSFELRSEKVRSIVGQIPSSLVRYGIVIIGGVLLCIVAVAYYFPYQQVYSGVAIAQGDVRQSLSDSVEVLIFLRFEGERLTEANVRPISLSDGGREIAHGLVLQLSSRRDTLERQVSICRLSAEDWMLIEKRAVDFQITVSSGTILSQILGRWLPIP